MTTPTYSTADGTVTGRTYSRLCQRLQQRGLNMDGQPVDIVDYYTGTWIGRVRYNTEAGYWEKWWRTADGEGRYKPLALPGEDHIPAPPVSKAKSKKASRPEERARYHVELPGETLHARSIESMCKKLSARGLTLGEFVLRDSRADGHDQTVRYNLEIGQWQMRMRAVTFGRASQRTRSVAVGPYGTTVTIPEMTIDGVTVPEHTAETTVPKHWVSVTEDVTIVTARPDRWARVPRTRGPVDGAEAP